MRMALLVSIGLLALSSAALVSLSTIVVGDTYCGRVAWDTNRDRPCTSAMQQRTIVAVTGLVVGGTLLLTAWRWRLHALLVAAGLAFVVLGLVRAFDPITTSYCGSVLNRHRYYEPSAEAACDDAVRPHRDQALAAGSGGAALVVGAAVLAWCRRRSAT